MNIAEIGKQPISEVDPAGGGVQGSPEFDALESEMNKLTSPSFTGGVNWNKVVDLSAQILGQKGKHLTVATYLCYALTRRDGWGGLFTGVGVLRDVLENFWDTMEPPLRRIRARKNIVEWWVDKTRESSATLADETWPAERRAALFENFHAIDAFLGEKMEDAPILRPMVDSIAGKIRDAAPQPPSQSQTAPSSATQPPASSLDRAASAAASPPPPVPPPSAGSGADSLLRAGMEYVRQASILMASDSISSPLPYILNRMAAWTTVTEAPPSADGKTRIPPPDRTTLAAVTNLCQAGNWRELILNTEPLVCRYLFWVDLSRYTAEALEQLGHAEAAHAVGQSVSAFLHRMPGIEKLSFSDGSLFANDDTRQWIMGIGAPTPSATAAPTPSDGADARVEAAIQEACKQISEEKLPPALTGLVGSAAKAPSLRESFLWKIGICRLLTRAKKARLALSHAKEILQTLDKYRVERWEPDLAVSALSTVLVCLRAQPEGKRDEGAIESAVDRLTTLDPARALELVV